MHVSLLAIKTTTRSRLGKLFVLELTKQQQMGSINLRRNKPDLHFVDSQFSNFLIPTQTHHSAAAHHKVTKGNARPTGYVCKLRPM